MSLPIYSKDDVLNALRGTARAFEAGKPDVSEATTDLIALGFYAALESMGLSFGVGDWREENRDE